MHLSCVMIVAHCDAVLIHSAAPKKEEKKKEEKKKEAPKQKVG